MAGLSSGDFERLLQTILSLQECVAFRDFPSSLIRATSTLISVDMCSYGEVDVEGRHAAMLTDHRNPMSGALLDTWASHTVGPEVLAVWRTLAPPQVIALSDFASQDELRSKEIWQAYFREIDINYQLIVPIVRRAIRPDTGSVPLAADRGPGLDVVCSMGFNRASGDFAAEERELFRHLAPHVHRAYRSAELLDRARDDRYLVITDPSWSRVRSGLILLTPERRVAFATLDARRWVEIYFGGFPPHSSALPATLQVWVSRCLDHCGRTKLPDRVPLRLDAACGRLEVSLIGTPEAARFMLVLRQLEPLPPEVASERLGLTARELEVARWLVQGKTNSEIGIVLGISSRTVQVHLRNIFAKLDVPSRSAAVAEIIERLSSREVDVGTGPQWR